ncbi:unnamed protein product [Schistosoma turkestanicum]|nr:unnamed protein product [Schistosoma turkestanicum]
MLTNHSDHHHNNNEHYFKENQYTTATTTTTTTTTTYNHNNFDGKIANDDHLEVNILQNYSKYYCHTNKQQQQQQSQFIPSPFMLFSWSKLMTTDVFRETLQNIIILSNCNNIAASLPATDSPFIDNSDHHLNSDIIDLTHRRTFMVGKYLNKLNTILFDYLTSTKDQVSSSTSTSITKSELDNHDMSKYLQQHECLNQLIHLHHLYANTFIKNINCESNYLFSHTDNRSLEETMVQFDKNQPIYSNNIKHRLNESMSTFNPSEEMNPSIYNPIWSTISTENHPIERNPSPIDKQTFVPVSSSASIEQQRRYIQSSIISLNKTKTNEIIPQTTINLNDEFIFSQTISCSLCKKCFRFEKNLLRHLQKTHATIIGDTLLKCKLCNYTTKHYSNMYVHIRTHTGDKPYSCSACGVSFTQGSSLKLHIRSRHNDNTSYFSLIRKPGKNNLTKLWTRVLKKDLSKFNTIKSMNSSACYYSHYYYYYYHNYWNKWKHSFNMEANNPFKNEQHQNELNIDTLNSNCHSVCSISNGIQNSPYTNDKITKEWIKSDDYQSVNSNSTVNIIKTKTKTHSRHNKLNNERLKFKHSRNQHLSKTKSNEQLIKQEKYEFKQFENYSTRTIDEANNNNNNSIKLEEPEIESSRNDRFSTTLNNSPEQPPIDNCTLTTDQMNSIQTKSMFTKNNPYFHDIPAMTCEKNPLNSNDTHELDHNVCSEQNLPFSIAALQPQYLEICDI